MINKENMEAAGSQYFPTKPPAWLQTRPQPHSLFSTESPLKS